MGEEEAQAAVEMERLAPVERPQPVTGEPLAAAPAVPVAPAFPVEGPVAFPPPAAPEAQLARAEVAGRRRAASSE